MKPRRVTLSDPIPGFDEGRPVPSRPGDSEKLRALRQAYAACLLEDDATPHHAGRQVLDDLAAFCVAAGSTTKTAPGSGAVDPLASALMEGRRQVWLLIASRLGLKLKGY